MGKKNKKIDIDRNTLYEMYIDKRMTVKEISSIYSCSNVCIGNYLKKYNIPMRSMGESVKLERSKWTEEKERTRSLKFIKTWSEMSPERKSLINEKKSHSNTPESIAKARKTRYLRKTNTKSKSEDLFYKRLLLYFNKEDIYRNYCLDSRYPYSCDFYIKSKDLFIEYQGHWTHGYEPFDENKEEHIKYLEKMQEKGIDMKTWISRDPLKLKTAIDNNINLILIYPNHNTYYLNNRKIITIDINDINKI